FEQRRIERRNSAPQSKGAIDVDPCLRVSGSSANVICRIEGPGVYVAGLSADDGLLVEHGQGVGSHASLIVRRHGDDTGSAKAEHGEGSQYGDVDFGSDHDTNRRSSEQAIFLDVPAGALEQSR